MVDILLLVRFEGPDVEAAGVPLDDLQKTLKHVQTAMQQMVRHLSGYAGRGRPPDWFRRESQLRLMGTSPGALVAELGLAQSNGDGLTEKYGQQAIARMVASEDIRSLPQAVADALLRIGTDLSPEVSVVQLADLHGGRQLEVRREGREYVVETIAPPPGSAMEKALLYGWLRAVDWEERTAKLSRHQGSPVSLTFTADHEQQMLQLAMQHVEVRGKGDFDRYDQWRSVQVEEIRGTGSWSEPFDLDAFRSDPNPKIFDTAQVIRASEPFDVDEFIRFVNDSRDDGDG